MKGGLEEEVISNGVSYSLSRLAIFSKTGARFQVQLDQGEKHFDVFAVFGLHTVGAILICSILALPHANNKHGFLGGIHSSLMLLSFLLTPFDYPSLSQIRGSSRWYDFIYGCGLPKSTRISSNLGLREFVRSPVTYRTITKFIWPLELCRFTAFDIRGLPKPAWLKSEWRRREPLFNQDTSVYDCRCYLKLGRALESSSLRPLRPTLYSISENILRPIVSFNRV